MGVVRVFWLEEVQVHTRLSITNSSMRYNLNTADLGPSLPH